MRHRSSLKSLAFKASKGTYGMLFLRPLIHFNALPITITIESARFFETTLGVVSNALLFLLLLTMGAVETRQSENTKES